MMASDDLYEITHPPGTRVLIGLLALLLVALSLFAWLATISETVTVTGEIEPADGTLDITAPRAGVVDRLLVHEGSHVVAGGLIGRIRSESMDSLGHDTKAIVTASMVDRRHSLLDQERTIGLARREAIANTADRLVALGREADRLSQQVALEQKLLALAEDDLRRAESIAGRGFISKLDLDKREETVLSRQQALAALEQAGASNSGARSLALASRQQDVSQSAAATGTLDRELAELNEQQAIADAGSGYTLIAPATGTISGLMIRSGSAVQADRVLMSLVQDTGTMVARLHLPTNAVGFLETGQTVRLSIDAYPYQQFGTVPGILRQISAATIAADAKYDGLYVATVTIPTPIVSVYGRPRRLMPGMTVVARIVTRRRSPLRWFAELFI